jgi:hypothetical protein
MSVLRKGFQSFAQHEESRKNSHCKILDFYFGAKREKKKEKKEKTSL